VGVVEPEHHRRFFGHRFEQAEERLEGAMAVLVGGPDRLRGDLRGQLREAVQGGGGEATENAVVLADQPTQGGDQRRVGQFVVAELDALAADRAAAPFAGAVEKGVEEAARPISRLALTRVATRRLSPSGQRESENVEEAVAAGIGVLGPSFLGAPIRPPGLARAARLFAERLLGHHRLRHHHLVGVHRHAFHSISKTKLRLRKAPHIGRIPMVSRPDPLVLRPDPLGPRKTAPRRSDGAVH
jgi:hypothetical protein